MFWVFGCWLMQDLSSSIGDWICISCIGRWSLNYWAARKFLQKFLIQYYHSGFQPGLPIRNCLGFFFLDINIQAAPQANETSVSLGVDPGIREFLKLPRWTQWVVGIESHWNVQFQMNNGSFKVYFELKLLPFSYFGLGRGHGSFLSHHTSLLLSANLFTRVVFCSVVGVLMGEGK